MRFIDVNPGDPRLGDLLLVLRELRAELTLESFEAIYNEGYPQGLRFTAAYDDTNMCVGVAGWRIIANTSAVRKLYVDDLVTRATARSTGVGHAILAELESRARDTGCTIIDLDSATHRVDAHRFYFRERFAITWFHFLKKL